MIMIIVIMLMNMVMNMFDVWSARLGHSRPLPAALPAPPTHKLRTKIPDNLPANFYPSNNTLIQALLVLLMTNMISIGKTWSDLLKLCATSSSSSPLSKLSLPHLYKYDSWLRILASDKSSPGLCLPLTSRLPPPPAAYIALHCTVTLVSQRNSA